MVINDLVQIIRDVAITREEPPTRKWSKGSKFLIPKQVNRLRRLEDGWLNGEGKAPASKGLDWLEETFSRLYSPELHLPYLYPTVEGGVQAEWPLGSVELSVEINLEQRSGWLYSLDFSNDEEIDRTLNLTSESAWSELRSLIEKYGGTRTRYVRRNFTSSPSAPVMDFRRTAYFPNIQTHKERQSETVSL
jgi:hypothetical protein